MEHSNFSAYSELASIDDLITQPSLMSHVDGRHAASEALSYLKSLRKLNSFELRVHEASIESAIKELNNFELAIEESIKRKKREKQQRLQINTEAAQKAKSHFEEKIKPAFETLIDEANTLSRIKGWHASRTTIMLKSMLNQIEKSIESSLIDPLGLDHK